MISIEKFVKDAEYALLRLDQLGDCDDLDLLLRRALKIIKNQKKAITIDACIEHFTKLADETLYAENRNRWDIVVAELNQLKARKTA